MTTSKEEYEKFIKRLRAINDKEIYQEEIKRDDEIMKIIEEENNKS